MIVDTGKDLASTYVLRPRLTERSPRFRETEVGGVVGDDVGILRE